ncbi:MAG TPA: hypothetical protein DCO75_01670 [Fibrobacteres bacterium]|nr:hypothetical protein [Fibrobacterota bacterium]
MKYNEQASQTLKKLHGNPANASVQREAGNLYWNALEENIVACVREISDCRNFLSQESDNINFGINTEAPEDTAGVIGKMHESAGSCHNVKVQLVSDWLADIFTKTMSGDRKASLEKELKITQLRIDGLEQDIALVKQQRREIITKETGTAFTSEALNRNMEKMDAIDELFRQNSKIKKMSSKGIFIPVEEKRKNCQRENDFITGTEAIEKFLSNIQSRDTLAAVKQFGSKLHENIAGIIDNESALARINSEIDDVAKKQSMTSPAEIASALSREIEYLRDLVKLSANRLRLECCCFLRPGDLYFTPKEIDSCIDRITSFDPAIFDNPRVSIFGIPTVLLTPGNGNAIYDWKNNRIIVPLVPPSGNFMASIAYGMIEYRLDVDEDKKLLTSYGKLPRHAGTKSVFHLKNELTKDYITWMTLEYCGYKSMAGDLRKWFEHEIAPDRNDIAVPLEFRPFFLSTEKFKEKCDNIPGLTAGSPESVPEEDLWAGSILLYQQGKFERSMELCKALIAKRPDHIASLYNMGHICMKLMRKQEAAGCFNEYCRLNPQSWWTSVAMEHIRKLQSNHS